jgi:hypothetical protein
LPFMGRGEAESCGVEEPIMMENREARTKGREDGEVKDEERVDL